VPNPAPGQRYYAWGQDHIGAASFIFLGAMQDQQGNATLSYVDSQHRNLLAYVGSFLVTEQAASIIPDQPSRDKTQWRYVATLPHTLSSSDHMSYLDHLRHLLVFDPTLEHFQVHYGINFWLLNTVQELSIQTLEMGAQSNLQEVRQTVVNLLSSLDGPCAHQEMSGTPESKMRANGVIAYAPNISLLDCVQEANQQGYLTRAAYELNAMVNAPGVPVQDAVRAVQMSKALNELRGHLQQMRTEALQVARMDDVHLLQNQILRNDLADQASDIISGGFDPATQTLQPGMKQICNEIAFLAHFDVVLYKSA